MDHRTYLVINLEFWSVKQIYLKSVDRLIVVLLKYFSKLRYTQLARLIALLRREDGFTRLVAIFHQLVLQQTVRSVVK